MANEGQEGGQVHSEKVDQVKNKTLGVAEVVASTSNPNLIQIKTTAKSSASTGNISEIGNKEIRHQHYVKLKREKKKDKKKRQEGRKKEAEALGTCSSHVFTNSVTANLRKTFTKFSFVMICSKWIIRYE